MGISWVDMGWYSGRLATTTAATGSVRFGVWAYFVAKQFDRITTAYRVCFSWLQHRTIRLRLKRYWPMLSRSYLYSWWAHARPQNFNFTFYHIFPSGNQSHGWKIPHLVQWFSQLSTISFEDFPLKAALTDWFSQIFPLKKLHVWLFRLAIHFANGQSAAPAVGDAATALASNLGDAASNIGAAWRGGLGIAASKFSGYWYHLVP